MVSIKTSSELNRKNLNDFLKRKQSLNSFYEIIEKYAVYKIEWSDYYDKYFELEAKKWLVKNAVFTSINIIDENLDMD